MRSRFVSAALSVMVLTIAASSVNGQLFPKQFPQSPAGFPPPTEQFPMWGTCGEKSNNGLTAITSFQSAVPIVFGLPAPAVDCKVIMLWKQGFPGERTGANKGGAFPGGSPGWPDDPVTFVQAVAFLKTKLDYHGTTAISNAYHEVYGRPMTPAEQAAWEPQVKAQTAWYATIAFAEIKKLNANQSARRSLVNAVYQASMGRNATPAERDYWVPRVEHYRLMLDAARAFLYSPAGLADLEQMIIRSATIKNGAAPTPAMIQDKLAIYLMKKPRPIYSEVIK